MWTRPIARSSVCWTRPRTRPSAAIGTVTLDSEEAIQAALDEVRESRVRFRSASAEQMQVCQEKLKSDPTKQASED